MFYQQIPIIQKLLATILNIGTLIFWYLWSKCQKYTIITVTSTISPSWRYINQKPTKQAVERFCEPSLSIFITVSLIVLLSQIEQFQLLMTIIAYLLPLIYNLLIGDARELVSYILTAYPRYMGYWGTTIQLISYSFMLIPISFFSQKIYCTEIIIQVILLTCLQFSQLTQNIINLILSCISYCVVTIIMSKNEDLNSIFKHVTMKKQQFMFLFISQLVIAILFYLSKEVLKIISHKTGTQIKTLLITQNILRIVQFILSSIICYYILINNPNKLLFLLISNTITQSLTNCDYSSTSLCVTLLCLWKQISLNKSLIFGIIGFQICRFLRNFVGGIQYYMFICQLCFKHKDEKWQHYMYILQPLLHIWNLIMTIISSAIESSLTSIAGTPILLPFGLYSQTYWSNIQLEHILNSKKQLQLTQQVQQDQLDKQEDLIIYQDAIQQIQHLTLTQKLPFISQPTKTGDVYLLMRGKQMITLQSIGPSFLNLQLNSIITCLETIETSCHTLERATLEAYSQYIEEKNKRQMENKSLQQDQRYLPKKLDVLNYLWGPKYCGAINMRQKEDINFCLQNMLCSPDTIQQVKKLYVRIIQILSDNIQTSQKAQPPQYLQKLFKELQITKNQEKIAYLINQNNEILRAQTEVQLLSSYINTQNVLSTKAARLALYIAIQAQAMGDDIQLQYNLVKQQISEIKSKISLINQHDKNFTQQLTTANTDEIFFISDDMKGHTVKYIKDFWHIFQINGFIANAVKSGLQLDLFYFNTSDDERWSVQSLPQICRNILGEMQVIGGYPLVIVGII